MYTRETVGSITSSLTITTMSFELPPPPPPLTPSTTFVVEHLRDYYICKQDNLRISKLEVPDIITISSITTYAQAQAHPSIGHCKTTYTAIVDALLVPATLGTFTRATLYWQTDPNWGQYPYLSPPIPAEGNRLLCRTYLNSNDLHFASNEVSMSRRFNLHQFRIILVTHLHCQTDSSPAVGAKLMVIRIS